MTDRKEIDLDTAKLLLDSLDFSPCLNHASVLAGRWTVWIDDGHSGKLALCHACNTLLGAVTWLMQSADDVEAYCIKDNTKTVWWSQ